MTNYYIETIKKHEAKWGKESAIQRASRWLCSLTLGREFGETVESYNARNPQIAEFDIWFHEFAS